MRNEKSEAERSLEKILRDSESPPASSLSQLLPQASFPSKSEQIKRNITEFIQNCFVNNQMVLQMIDRGVKSVSFQTQYQKKLALFSVQMLSGDYGDSHKLFIEGEQMKSLLRSRSLKNQSEIEEEIETQSNNPAQNFNRKYKNFMYLLQNIRKTSDQIPEINMNYMIKILSNIISNKPEQVYAYFHQDYHNKSASQKKEQNKNEKSDLQYLIEHSYYFGGVAEMLAKLVSEQGSANNYLDLKKIIIDKFLDKLKSEDLIKLSPNNYSQLLQFPSYLLSRTKYRSDDSNQQIAKITQRFVDESVIWYFKEKVVKAAIQSNGLLNNNYMNSSGTLGRSESSKSVKKENQLKPENQQQFSDLEATFENSLQYLKIIAERINNEEEMDSFENQSGKTSEPTMDFQVDEALYGQNSLYELFILQIPFIYKSMNKMGYYELLLKLTRNSRYQKSNSENQIGLLPSFLMPILIHLLKMFRRQSRRNGLVNLYIQQLISEAVLPRIQKFDNKEAMMVLSALNPSEQVLLKYDDTRMFTQKMLLILSRKCEWFGEHFLKLGVNLAQIRQRLTTKLGNNDFAYQNRKYTTKQLLFLADEAKKPQKQIQKKSKNERLQDSDSSGSQKQAWNPIRRFEFPEGFADKEQDKKKQENTNQNQSSDLQQNLFKSSESEIVQQIRVLSSEAESEENAKNQVQRKQSEIELMVDSAGEEDEVLREDMKPQSPS